MSNKEKKKGIKNLKFGYLYSLICGIIVIICMTLSSNFQYAKKVTFELDNWIIFLCGIAFYVLVFLISKVTQKITPKKLNIIMLIVSCLFAVLLFFVARSYSFTTDWDVRKILKNAEMIALGNKDRLENKYYSIYPNNILLTQLFSVAYKIADITKIGEGYDYLLAYQCALYAFTGYFVYKICTCIHNDNNMPIMVWLIYIILIGFSPWVIIPYSDATALFIVTLIAYCYSKLFQIPNGKKKKIYFSMMIFFSILGYYIKPQIVIFLIAVCIVFIFTRKKEIMNIKNIKNIKKYKDFIAILFITIVITVSSINIIKGMSGINIDKEKKFGISHFLMMGWNTDYGGVYADEDIWFSKSFDANTERRKANIETFKSRIKEMGVSGVKNLAIRKTLTNYNDGTFAFGQEGEFFLKEYKTGNKNFRKLFNNIYKPSGKYYSTFQLVMQIVWMGTLIFNILAINRENDEKIYTMQLSIIGLTIFETMFEARARYLFAYVPIYIILASTGFNNIYVLVKKAIRGKNKNESFTCNTNVL